MISKDIVMLLVFAICLFAGMIWLDRETCLAKSISFEDVNYSFFGGCMVKHKGMWLPLDNVRSTE